MLGYSPTIVKKEQMNAALAYIEENNNNKNHDKCNNNKKYGVRTKDQIIGRNDSVISTQYASNFKGVFAQVRLKYY